MPLFSQGPGGGDVHLGMITIDNLTVAMIEQLAKDAASVGDEAMVADCRRVLDGRGARFAARRRIIAHLNEMAEQGW